jgi:uncharacterized Zn finger protein
MDNQHRKISGYRELDQTEIDAMNQVKHMAASVGRLIDAMSSNPGIDQRWLAIGKTDLQKGFMSLTRSIAKPEFF